MKRQKANLCDLIDNNISYFYSVRMIYTKDNIKYNGTMYHLCTEEDRPKAEALEKKFKNVVVSYAGYRYAPEYQKTVIFIADKIIK